MDAKTAVLAVNGARCASCTYAIEHMGRKVPGVQEVRVNPGSQEIRVTYSGEESALERIVEIVARLGYEASVRSRGQ